MAWTVGATTSGPLWTSKHSTRLCGYGSMYTVSMVACLPMHSSVQQLKHADCCSTHISSNSLS